MNTMPLMSLSVFECSDCGCQQHGFNSIIYLIIRRRCKNCRSTNIERIGRIHVEADGAVAYDPPEASPTRRNDEH